MIDSILDLANVGKSYRSYRSAWWRAKGWITGKPTHFTDHWVLRNVTFSVRSGEAVGIVGRNGAGKSTLLKLIAGTLSPTEGALAMRGSVSAILELGMGFNPEFSARENATHSCGLLGYEAARIVEIMPWIATFADIGEAFDQPMRTYSSGMAVRVAFAVATAVRPDILIVDEALSVGDAAFQRKSFRRIEEFLANGTSLLFVSHGADAVRNLCDRAVWLDHGRIRLEGDAKSVTEAYEKDLFMTATLLAPTETTPDHGFMDGTITSDIEVEYGDLQARIRNIEIRNSLNGQVNTLPMGERFAIIYEVEFFEECQDAHFGLLLKTVDGITAYGTNTDSAGLRNKFAAGDIARVSFVLQNNLCPGVYYLNCGASRAGAEGRTYLHKRVDAVALRVVHGPHAQVVAGLANLGAAIDISVREAVPQ